MMELINAFYEKKITFNTLVSDLEGCFLAGNFREENLVEGWKEEWFKLETIKAIALDKKRKIEFEEVLPKVEQMKKFLMEHRDLV